MLSWTVLTSPTVGPDKKPYVLRACVADALSLTGRAAQGYTPCASHLIDMLGCWASTGDKRSTAQCMDFANALHSCMRTHVRTLVSSSAHFLTRWS